jgi:hypothetical protein
MDVIEPVSLRASCSLTNDLCRCQKISPLSSKVALVSLRHSLVSRSVLQSRCTTFQTNVRTALYISLTRFSLMFYGLNFYECRAQIMVLSILFVTNRSETNELRKSLNDLPFQVLLALEKETQPCGSIRFARYSNLFTLIVQ